MVIAEVPFDLVEVKLGAPSTRPGTVAKQDVIGRLRASRLPFATVIAPAGYGKTTLLARWAESDPRPFAWVALDGREQGTAGAAPTRSSAGQMKPEVVACLTGWKWAAMPVAAATRHRGWCCSVVVR
jgi:LuxR family maltose regulon positive regulatory protein